LRSVKHKLAKSLRLPLIGANFGASGVVFDTWVFEFSREREIVTQLAMQIGWTTCVAQYLCCLHFVTR